jgi:hypothetical protein
MIVSGYPSALYQEILADWRAASFDIANHAASGKQKGRETECLWMNFELESLKDDCDPRLSILNTESATKSAS